MKILKKIFGNWKWMGKSIGSCDQLITKRKCDQLNTQRTNNLTGRLLVKNKEIRDLKRENLYLSDALEEAVKYLKQGKAKFTPNTTNSFVDEFIKRHGKS